MLEKLLQQLKFESSQSNNKSELDELSILERNVNIWIVDDSSVDGNLVGICLSYRWFSSSFKPEPVRWDQPALARPFMNPHVSTLHISTQRASAPAGACRRKIKRICQHLPLPPPQAERGPAPWSDDCKHAGGSVLKTHCAGRASAFSNGDLRVGLVCVREERCRECSSHTLALRLQLHWRTSCKSNSLPATEAPVLVPQLLQVGIILLFCTDESAADSKIAELHF